MKTINSTFKQMVAEVPANVKIEVDLSFAISNRIDALIKKKGLTKKRVCRIYRKTTKRSDKMVKWTT